MFSLNLLCFLRKCIQKTSTIHTEPFMTYYSNYCVACLYMEVPVLVNLTTGERKTLLDPLEEEEETHKVRQ